MCVNPAVKCVPASTQCDCTSKSPALLRILQPNWLTTTQPTFKLVQEDSSAARKTKRVGKASDEACSHGVAQWEVALQLNNSRDKDSEQLRWLHVITRNSEDSSRLSLLRTRKRTWWLWTPSQIPCASPASFVKDAMKKQTKHDICLANTDSSLKLCEYVIIAKKRGIPEVNVMTNLFFFSLKVLIRLQEQSKELKAAKS